MEFSKEEQALADKAFEHAKKIRTSIANKYTDPNIYTAEKRPVSVFMAGSPGAGKTEVSKELIQLITKDAVVRVDPDELRELFEDYNGSNSYIFQSATSKIVEKILDKLHQRSISFLLDGTFASYCVAERNVRRSLDNKRQVNILFVYQDPTQAWSFVQERELQEGRRILPETFISQFINARETANRIKQVFKKEVVLDLIVKNINGTNKFMRSNVDNIDSHIGTLYDRATLEQIIS